MLKKILRFLLRNTTTKQTIAKNTFWLAISQIGGRLLRSLIIIYAARVLGAEQWGVFSYATTLVAFLSLFVDIGINSILTRETVLGDLGMLNSKSILSATFFIKITLLSIAVLFVLFIAPYLSTIEAAKSLFPLVAMIMIFDTLREFCFSIMRAREQMEFEGVLFTFTNFSIVVFGFFFLMHSPTVLSFTYAYVFGTGLGALATIISLRKDLMGLPFFFRFKHIKPILSIAWPFAISSILGLFMLNADILILGFFKNSMEVGLYSAGNRVVQLLYMLPGIITASALPTFTRLAALDAKKMRSALERIISILFLFSVPMGIGGVLFGKRIIIFLFGSSYAPASVSFQILMLSLIVDFSAIALSNAIFAFNKQRYLIINTGVAAFINVAGDFLLIPYFGMNGSAIATLVAQIVSMAYLWKTARSIVPFSITKYFFNIVLASLVMSCFAFVFIYLAVPLIPSIIILIIIYFSFLYAIKDPLISEIKNSLSLS